MKASAKWTVCGALFGALLPILAGVIRLWQFPIDAALSAIFHDPLFYIICTAPFFLGAFAYLGGRQHQNVLDLNDNLEGEIAARTRQLEHERQNAIDQAKLVTLGTMAGGVAHEINNPLSIVQGYCYQLRKMFCNNKEAFAQLERPLNEIEKTVARIATTVRALRAYSRKDIKDPIEIIDIHALVEETIALCADSLRHEGVAIDISRLKQCGNLKVSGRRAALMQVLINLLNNSRDAMRNAAGKLINISATITDDIMELHVTDNGPGISEENVGKIMEPFFTTKPPGQGTGLGLSVSNSVLQAMGGRMELRSRMNPTEFVLILQRPESNEISNNNRQLNQGGGKIPKWLQKMKF